MLPENRRMNLVHGIARVPHLPSPQGFSVSHRLSLPRNPISLTAPRRFHPPGDDGGGGLAWLTASSGGASAAGDQEGRRRQTPRAGHQERPNRQHRIFSKFAYPPPTEPEVQRPKNCLWIN